MGGGGWRQAVKFSLIILISSHTVGCVFFFLARLFNFDSSTWVSDFEQLLPLYSSESPLATHYLICVYKVLPRARRPPPPGHDRTLSAERGEERRRMARACPG